MPVGDGHLKVLAHLVAVDDLTHLLADLRGTQGCFGPPLHLALDLLEQQLGGVQQLVALAFTLFGQQRIEAGDEPFIGKVR